MTSIAQARTNILTRFKNATKQRDPETYDAYTSGYLTWPNKADLVEEDIPTAPGTLSLDDLEAWVRLRGAEDPSHVAELLETYAGWTENELDEEYDRICGPIA